MQWSPNFRFISDDPLKALGKESGLAGSDVLAVLAPALQRATRLITVISPYFVPGKEGTRYFVDQVARGTGVRDGEPMPCGVGDCTTAGFWPQMAGTY